MLMVNMNMWRHDRDIDEIMVLLLIFREQPVRFTETNYMTTRIDDLRFTMKILRGTFQDA